MKISDMIKKAFVYIADKLGFEISRKIHTVPIDLRERGNSPLGLLYFSPHQRQVVIEVNLNHGRGLDLFPLDNVQSHPFTYAIHCGLNAVERRTKIKEVLSTYYQNILPSSAANWLGLSAGEAPSLDNVAATCAVFPWENVSLHRKLEERKVCAIHDNREHGLNVGLEKGWRNFGPVSQEIVELETKRLFSLICSIEEKGFVRNTGPGGDIGCIVLMKEDGDFRWLVEWGGQHRAAAAAALGLSKVSVRVWQVVRREDVNFWPGVLSGIYTPQSALKVFDSVFSGILGNKYMRSSFKELFVKK